VKEIDDRLDAVALVDLVWDHLTDNQAAVCMLIMAGYSNIEIARHFEWTRANVNEYLYSIRRTALKVMRAFGVRVEDYLPASSKDALPLFQDRMVAMRLEQVFQPEQEVVDVV